MDFSNLTGDELIAALELDLAATDNDGLAAALADRRTAATALFGLDAPTIAQVNDVEALVASIHEIETEQGTRAAAVEDAAQRFAAARESFSNEGDVETEETEVTEEGDDTEDEESEETTETDESEDGDDAGAEGDEGETEEGTEAVTASARNSQIVRTNAAKKVGRKVKRPAVNDTPQVTITASADVPQFATGQVLDGMEQVTKALLNRVKGFARFNAQAAQAVNSQSGGEPVLSKFGVASFGIPFAEALVASANNEYAAVQAALKQDRFGVADGVLTAAGWCAPSENIYSFIADYVVDGLVTVPEVSAPRGGINITTGPERSSQGSALGDFGFVQTEAQAEAGTQKTCETIECPDFVDHRLDAIGYCYKIPLLTQKAYPELITDALRFANVLYAHKVNARIISDMVGLSTAVNAMPMGASFTDTLEALSIIAVKERRKWNVGVNAVMEVKLPQFVKEVFRADLSRRRSVALDVVTDASIDANFAARGLAVEYVSDWQELTGDDAIWPGSFEAMIYPAGTFIKAVEDVINLSAVYDAASLSINEYTGVFFEQGILVAKAGYGSSLVTIPVCTAGASGAGVFACEAGSL